MGNDIYRDESWKLEFQDTKREGVEEELEELGPHLEPLNEVVWIDESMVPDIKAKPWSHELFLKLMTGPSTNFYVGPQEKHYTIPRRLFDHFSGYAKACLGGVSSESSADPVWLLDVDPNVFQYLWQWLYTGKVRLQSFYASNPDLDDNQRLVQACQLLCQAHMLGERLLFDNRFLESGVEMQLEKVIEEAKTEELPMPLRPDMVEEVLSGFALAQYEESLSSCGLRLVVLKHLCNFQFCTTVDFTDYENCFQKDGTFAAELLIFLASEIKWAKERGEAQIGRQLYVFGIEEQATEEQHIMTTSKLDEGVWVALRHICTSEGYTTNFIRSFSRHFELNAAFAAAFLNQMAKELLWTIKRWGEELGQKVDVAAEKEREGWIADNQQLLNKNWCN